MNDTSIKFLSGFLVGFCIVGLGYGAYFVTTHPHFAETSYGITVSKSGSPIANIGIDFCSGVNQCGYYGSRGSCVTDSSGSCVLYLGNNYGVLFAVYCDSQTVCRGVSVPPNSQAEMKLS